MEGLGVMFHRTFSGKTVLITGHTGFKGSWLCLWLHRLGARVVGCALDPPTNPSNFELSKIEPLLHEHVLADIRDSGVVSELVRRTKPDFIFHLAAQPLVRESYCSPRETFEINVIGTACLLDAIRDADCSTNVVVVTSDKCYQNREHVWGYRESDALGGHDPYSASKGCTEILTASYCQSFFPPDRIADHGVCLATARAGNVIGGGDWARDRIFTDIVAALRAGKSVEVRCPDAVRPWQHVLEPLSGYLTLAARMSMDRCEKWCGGWNFGPTHEATVPVRDICRMAIDAWKTGQWTDVSNGRHPHEAGILRLCIDKATSQLNWHPRWSVSTAVNRTMNWYRRLESGACMRQVCIENICEYESLNQVSCKPARAA